jgi:hypothetical protein
VPVKRPKHFIRLADRIAPMGYQDLTGFHYGTRLEVIV